MPLSLLPSYHPHPSRAIFMYSYFLYYTSISNCVLSLFLTSFHILTLDPFLFCVFHVKSERCFNLMKKNTLRSPEEQLPGARHTRLMTAPVKITAVPFRYGFPMQFFPPFFCFCRSTFPHRHMDYLYPAELCATVVHLLDLFVLSQRVSLQRICPSHRDGCREQSRDTTRSQSQKSRAPAAAMIM